VNELMMGELLDAFATAVALVYGGNVSAKAVVSQIDLLYVIIDEMIEGGHVFEGNAEVVASRALLKSDGALEGASLRSSV